MWKEQKGITLVELLAVLSLMSIIIMLVGSAMMFGQKQYKNQTEIIEQQDQVRYVMATLTKEIRSHNSSQISVSGNVLNIGSDSYEFSAPQVLKNGTPMSDRIGVFEVEKNDLELDITIASSAVGGNEQQRLSTILYLRK
ncbi:PilW family protein [Paraliobacillus salinarum]|uniref:PilW family protein n=1 Tax=Paraliobacillus salinarum TaxID=1158996 RepID=UPI0015F5DE13|nr:prepilin-type N-terminal cleavage/methylation domain-containing protein [Paraliobacillus salinarum]